MLSFQRMDVYRCAVELLALAMSVKVPRGQGDVGDQLRRAALSISLNIGEAAGRPSPAEAGRHYGIARGSAMECAAIFDALQILGALADEQHERAIALITRLVAMLTKLS